jgi:hypothetical protein
MKRIRRVAIAFSCLSGVVFFMISNTVLALPPGDPPRHCHVLFLVPFTEASVQLPDWMWGGIPFSVWLLSTLGALSYWTAFMVRRRSEGMKGFGNDVAARTSPLELR